VCAFVCACGCMCKREKERERERERLRAYTLTTGFVYTLMTNRLIVPNCHELSRIVICVHTKPVVADLFDCVTKRSAH